MKKKLTSEQLEMRKKTNSKILKFGCLPILVFCIIVIILISGNDDKNDNSVKSDINMDSIVSSVKKSKDFEIKEVYYNKIDSSFNIAITNKDNVIKEHSYSIEYFNKFYKLNDIDEIEGVYLYEYKKGKSFKNEDYKEYLVCSSKNISKRIEKFEKSGYEYDIKSYLEKNIDDPTDLEIIEKNVIRVNEDGTFSVKVVFRSKNAFGAFVIHTMNCDLDEEGNGKNVVFDN